MSTKDLKMPSYGGQALIEGVLMRGQKYAAAAFRRPDGEIEIHSEPLGNLYQSSVRKIPFLRGLIILWDALGLGTRFLTLSANIQGGEDEKIEGKTLVLTLVVSISLAIGLFFLLPALISRGVAYLTSSSHFAANLIEGLVRLVIIIAYMWIIGLSKEIRAVFAYHGAEHKTINAFESGSPLIPSEVAKYSLEHPRCGTAFLFTLIVISILVFSLLGDLSIWMVILSRIILIPVLAMLAYEYIRFTADHLDNRLIRWLSKPSLALQKLTTREPTEAQIEVAIAAFNEMTRLETGQA